MVSNILNLPIYLLVGLTSITSQLVDAFLGLHTLLLLFSSPSLLPSPISPIQILKAFFS